ncbi:MAG: helix-hairpin-helix domain-containing protein [Eggerthellaceae bacterium]
MSLGRRLQDPLAELVKIPPQSIGVGQYQHDLNQAALERALTGVVENVVNRVGVDLNTASASLLGYVAGVSATVAKNIVAYREENGAFTDRGQLKKVPKLGAKAFQNCAGFLRISDGKNPLDATSVHPESYAAAKELLKRAKVKPEALANGGVPDIASRLGDVDALAAELGVGAPTLRDIVAELEKPGRDPRDGAPEVVFSKGIRSFDDLVPGMELTGTVRNVVDFGAFVDVGVKQDGLVHVSKMADRFVKHPSEVATGGHGHRVGDRRGQRPRQDLVVHGEGQRIACRTCPGKPTGDLIRCSACSAPPTRTADPTPPSGNSPCLSDRTPPSAESAGIPCGRSGRPLRALSSSRSTSCP